MFGYRIIKNVEFETLKAMLKDADLMIEEKKSKIAELLEKINEQEKVIAKLTASTVVKTNKEEKSEKSEKSEKPVKKTKRKYTKKTTKKEE